MRQICLTCKSVKNIKDTTHKTKKANWKIKVGLKTIFPNDEIPDLNNIKEYKPKNSNVKQILNLSKNDVGKYLLYYAADMKQSCNKIPTPEVSYNNFSNRGITKVNSDGHALINLRCPNMYQTENKSFYPHVHYVLSNQKNTKWINKLYTKVIICDINKKEIKDKIKSNCTMIINALPIEYYIKSRIPNSISLPQDQLKKLSDKEIINYIKSMIKNYPKLNKLVENKKIKVLDIPIITYCYKKTCDASDKLVDRLLEVGFKNIKEYSNGIQGWFGKHD
jgi:hypothetical protein